MDGQPGLMEQPVIISQSMAHGDGFTLFGFESWEDVHKEEMIEAATNVAAFQFSKDKVGF
jgi:hypothetical protein